MLIAEGLARNERIDLALACSLAAISGALNAAAFYAVGFFSANMTGNVSLFSDKAAEGNWLPALFFLTIVVVFIAGAAVSALMISAGRRRGNIGIYAYSIFSEAVLLAALAAADLWLLAEWRSTVLVLGLAFLMGLQNATVTRISDARVRTTHVSGLATDIGIEIGVAIDIARGRDTQTDAAHNMAKLRLHGATILSFLAGGVAGVLVYREIGAGLLFICSGALSLIATRAIFHVRKRSRQNGASGAGA